MRTSIFRAIRPLLPSLIGLLLPLPLSAAALPGSAAVPLHAESAALAQPALAILPLQYEVPRAGSGIASILADELAAGGRFEVIDPASSQELLADRKAWLRLSAGRSGCGLDAAQLSSAADYLLCGSIVSLNLADKYVRFDAGAEFRDLAAVTGGGSRIAQAKLELRLFRCCDGALLWSGSIEGLESQHGIRRKEAGPAWLGSVDYGADEFRQSMLGRAAYKAVGEALRSVYDALPFEARILAVTSNGVVLNLDEASGLRRGDELQVFSVDSLTNSVGMPVWETQRRVGSLQVVDFQPGRCLCLILDGQGSIAEGDVARPLAEPRLLPREANRR